MDFQIKVFIALTFNAVMYENGEPLFKIRNIVILRERIIRDFDTCMGVFMKFVKDCSKHSERKTDSDSEVRHFYFLEKTSVFFSQFPWKILM